MTFAEKLLWCLPWICIGYGLGVLVQHIHRVRDGMPPTTRRAINRRRQRLGLDLDRPLGCRCGWGLGECRMCFEARTGLTLQEAREQYGDPSRAPAAAERRVADAIRKLDGAEPKRGWQARVWAKIGKERGRE